MNTGSPSPSPRSGDRNQALEQIAALAREFELNGAEIEAAIRRRQADPGVAPGGSLLSKILGFFGGIFIFSGIAVFITLNWDSMNSAERIIVTLGAGVSLFVMALVACHDRRFEKARMPLFLISALLQPAGILVAINEFSSGGDWHYAVLLAAGAMLAQQLTVFVRYRFTELLFTATVFAVWFIAVFLDLLLLEELNAVITGGCLVLFCVALEKYTYRTITPFFYFMGSVAFLGGVFSLVEGEPTELLFLLVASGGVVLSAYLASRTLLFTSILFLFGYIGYFTNRYFLDSIGWPLALIFLGIVFILLAALALKVNRNYLRRPVG